METQVAKLSVNEKNALEKQSYTEGMLFNPIQDENGFWIISVEEVNACTNKNFIWVKILPLIPYVPPVYVEK